MRPRSRQIRVMLAPVQTIAPQHGYVITGDLVPLFLERMEQLLVGYDLLALEPGRALCAGIPGAGDDR